jgi:hypothetical protein
MLVNIFEPCKVNLNISDDDVVVHNIYGSSHQAKGAQFAWS